MNPEIRNPNCQGPSPLGSGSEIVRLALIGAGGKMGCRIMDHLRHHPGYELRCVERGAGGLAGITARGLRAVPMEQAVGDADAVVLALPDRVLGKVAHGVVPWARPGALVVMLDPAAAHAGELPERADISYFVSHPCHPSVFDHFETAAEREDFFGGTTARQAIVCALMQGPESDYARGERLAMDFYAPVSRSHRITVGQMALLEPAMAETVGICLIRALREALEEVIARGVPRAAAEDFLFGHIRVPLGIAFERVDFPFSDGANLIANYGRTQLMMPDWKKVFEPGSVRAQCKAITTGEAPP